MRRTDDQHLPSPVLPKWSRAGDVLFFVLFAAFWLTHVTTLVVFEKCRTFDVFRDIGAAVNFQNGQWWADPALKGETPWYPPLSPLVIAGVSSLTGLSPGDCYRWSQLVLNWMIPVGLYLIVRRAWGTRAAWGAVIAMLFAMPWWQTHVAAGQPSFHAVIGGWVALVLYARAHRRGSLRWAAACGVFQALACLHHPLVPMTLTAAFAMHGIWEVWRIRRQTGAFETCRAQLARTAWVVGPAVLIGGPLIALYQHGPELNPEPRAYLAPEMLTQEFALLGGNPWLWGVGLLGLVCAFRRDTWPGRLLVTTLLVCVIGQLPAYLRTYGPTALSTLPMVVPHQFQMFFQLAWPICIGVGLDAIVRTVAARQTMPRRRAGLSLGLTMATFVLTGASGLVHARSNMRRFLVPMDFLPESQAAVKWIRTHTDIQDVFLCDPPIAFFWLIPETGRKVWMLPPCHSNPRVDWNAHLATFTRLGTTTSPAEFNQVARAAGIKYVLPTESWTPRIISDRDLARETVPKYLHLVYELPGQVIIFQVTDPP